MCVMLLGTIQSLGQDVKFLFYNNLTKKRCVIAQRNAPKWFNGSMPAQF
jgi:hypothetical protein